METCREEIRNWVAENTKRRISGGLSPSIPEMEQRSIQGELRQERMLRAGMERDDVWGLL